MAKVKNTGNQPRGFFTEEGGHITVGIGEEKEFNMTEADFNHTKKMLDGLDDNEKPFELSGSAGGVKDDKKKKGEGENPAQSSEPPPNAPAQVIAPPQTDDKREDRRPGQPPHKEDESPRRR